MLAPLALDDAGWGTVAIAATFVCAGLIEVALARRPWGRSATERGRLYPVRLGLWGLAGVALALSFLDLRAPASPASSWQGRS